MAYHGVCNKSNIMDVTSGAGIAYPFGASEFIAGFGEIHVAIYSFLCSGLSLLCPSFAHCAVHRFMLSDYPFGIVKLFLVLVLDLHDKPLFVLFLDLNEIPSILSTFLKFQQHVILHTFLKFE